MKKIILALLMSASILSCQKSDSNDLQDAQTCLNNSAPTQARSCVENIKSINSASSYKLQCAAIFISEGFGSATTLISTMQKINENETCIGTCSSTLSVMSVFNFSSNTIADEAFSVCENSESKGYTQISSLFKIGTLLRVLAGVANPTPDQLKGQLGNLPAADLGEIVLQTYAGSCANVADQSDSSKKYCDELAASIGNFGSNTNNIGACLKKKLDNPAATCP